jgi:hypothetical protein
MITLASGYHQLSRFAIPPTLAIQEETCLDAIPNYQPSTINHQQFNN